MTIMVTGICKTRIAAESAINKITTSGFTRNEISVLMSDARDSKEFAIETGTHAADGAGIGGAIGFTVGAVLAASTAIGSNLVLPGLGIVIAGPIAAALAGAGAGGVAGSLVGALIGAGVTEHRAKVYNSGLRNGGILLGIEAKDKKEAAKLEQLLEEIGAQHIRQK
jgi:hypothetical protein